VKKNCKKNCFFDRFALYYLKVALQTCLFIALSQLAFYESAVKGFFGNRSFLQKFLWEKL